MKIRVLAVLILCITTGCHKRFQNPLEPPTLVPYGHHTWMIMGQSNAVRFAQYGGPDAFNVDIQSFAPGTITWINCSVGGTAVSEWQKTAPQGYYQACLAAAVGHNIDGILWEQGEAEAEQGDPAICDAWTGLFTTMINSFRADIGNPRAVVLYTRLGQASGLPNTQEERQAQEAVHIQYGRMVDLDSIKVPLGLHYNPEDYPKIAQLYASTYYELLSGK